MFLEISQNSQECTCVRVSFLIRLQAWSTYAEHLCATAADEKNYVSQTRHIPDIIRIMVNKCTAPSCRSGCAKNTTKYIAKFHFPLKNFELKKLWIRFLNRKDWKPTKHSVLCELHFEETYIVWGGKSNLKWLMNPIPTKHSKELLKNAIIVTTNQ